MVYFLAEEDGICFSPNQLIPDLPSIYTIRYPNGQIIESAFFELIYELLSHYVNDFKTTRLVRSLVIYVFCQCITKITFLMQLCLTQMRVKNTYSL